jgi:hypothetical protein
MFKIGPIKRTIGRAVEILSFRFPVETTRQKLGEAADHLLMARANGNVDLHRFLDGNGRNGRLLIAPLFCHESMLRERLPSSRLYFEQHRQRYCDEPGQPASRAARSTHPPEPIERAPDGDTERRQAVRRMV